MDDHAGWANGMPVLLRPATTSGPSSLSHLSPQVQHTNQEAPRAGSNMLQQAAQHQQQQPSSEGPAHSHSRGSAAAAQAALNVPVNEDISFSGNSMLFDNPLEGLVKLQAYASQLTAQGMAQESHLSFMVRQVPAVNAPHFPSTAQQQQQVGPSQIGTSSASEAPTIMDPMPHSDVQLTAPQPHAEEVALPHKTVAGSTMQHPAIEPHAQGHTPRTSPLVAQSVPEQGVMATAPKPVPAAVQGPVPAVQASAPAVQSSAPAAQVPASVTAASATDGHQAVQQPASSLLTAAQDHASYAPAPSSKHLLSFAAAQSVQVPQPVPVPPVVPASQHMQAQQQPVPSAVTPALSHHLDSTHAAVTTASIGSPKGATRELSAPSLQHTNMGNSPTEQLSPGQRSHSGAGNAFTVLPSFARPTITTDMLAPSAPSAMLLPPSSSSGPGSGRSYAACSPRGQPVFAPPPPAVTGPGSSMGGLLPAQALTPGTLPILAPPPPPIGGSLTTAAPPQFATPAPPAMHVVAATELGVGPAPAPPQHRSVVSTGHSSPAGSPRMMHVARSREAGLEIFRRRSQEGGVDDHRSQSGQGAPAIAIDVMLQQPVVTGNAGTPGAARIQTPVETAGPAAAAPYRTAGVRVRRAKHSKKGAAGTSSDSTAAQAARAESAELWDAGAASACVPTMVTHVTHGTHGTHELAAPSQPPNTQLLQQQDSGKGASSQQQLLQSLQPGQGASAEQQVAVWGDKLPSRMSDTGYDDSYDSLEHRMGLQGTAISFPPGGALAGHAASVHGGNTWQPGPPQPPPQPPPQLPRQPSVLASPTSLKARSSASGLGNHAPGFKHTSLQAVTAFIPSPTQASSGLEKHPSQHVPSTSQPQDFGSTDNLALQDNSGEPPGRTSNDFPSHSFSGGEFGLDTSVMPLGLMGSGEFDFSVLSPGAQADPLRPVRVPVPQVLMPAFAPAMPWDMGTTSVLLGNPLTEGPKPVLKPPAACEMDSTTYAASQSPWGKGPPQQLSRITAGVQLEEQLGAHGQVAAAAAGRQPRRRITKRSALYVYDVTERAQDMSPSSRTIAPPPPPIVAPPPPPLVPGSQPEDSVPQPPIAEPQQTQQHVHEPILHGARPVRPRKRHKVPAQLGVLAASTGVDPAEAPSTSALPVPNAHMQQQPASAAACVVPAIAPHIPAHTHAVAGITCYQAVAAVNGSSAAVVVDSVQAALPSQEGDAVSPEQGPGGSIHEAMQNGALITGLEDVLSSPSRVKRRRKRAEDADADGSLKPRRRRKPVVSVQPGIPMVPAQPLSPRVPAVVGSQPVTADGVPLPPPAGPLTSPSRQRAVRRRRPAAEVKSENGAASSPGRRKASVMSRSAASISDLNGLSASPSNAVAAQQPSQTAPAKSRLAAAASAPAGLGGVTGTDSDIPDLSAAMASDVSVVESDSDLPTAFVTTADIGIMRYISPTFDDYPPAHHPLYAPVATGRSVGGAWGRATDTRLPVVVQCVEVHEDADDEHPWPVINPLLPDLCPGDDLASVVSWLRHVSLNIQPWQRLDQGCYHTYEQRYLEGLQRARVLFQTVGELDPADPLASPDNLDGQRPLSASERRAMRRAMALEAAKAGDYGYRPRFQAGLANKQPQHRLLVGNRYQAELPPPPPPRPAPGTAAAQQQSTGQQAIEKPKLTAMEAAMLGVPVMSPAHWAEREAEMAARTAAAAATGSQSSRPKRTTQRAASAAAAAEQRRKKNSKQMYPPYQDACAAVQQKLVAAESLQERHRIMDETIRDLDQDMTDLLPVLGLADIGSKVRAQGWTAADEAAFAAGLRDHDREFGDVQKNHLPHKSMADIISYYYNIWKIRYTADSVAWHEERRQLKAMMEEYEERYGEGEEEEEEEGEKEEAARESTPKPRRRRKPKGPLVLLLVDEKYEAVDNDPDDGTSDGGFN